MFLCRGIMAVMWILAQAQDGASHSFPVIVASIVVTAICVVIHYETVALMIRIFRNRLRRLRYALVLIVFGLIVVHLLEIALFAIAHSVLQAMYGGAVGDLAGDYDGSLTDQFYFSIAVYTTVGFGDITPHGPIRIMAGVEALVGLVMITWSASFTFLVMQYRFQRVHGEGATAGHSSPPGDEREH